MLLVLFALSAHAQPAGYGPFAGQGTSSPFTGPSSAAPRFPSDEYQGPTRFALNQADLNVAINRAHYNGNRVFLNFESFPLPTPFEYTTPFPGLGRAFLADSAAKQERYFQNEIDYIRATTPVLTRADRDKIDDLALQREYAYNTKLRRGVGFVPLQLPAPLGPFSSVFDVRAKNAGWVLAENKLTDARRAYQADPSRENYIALQNALDGVEQADLRQGASSFDLLGATFNGGALHFGGVFRKKASETKLQIGLRNLRLARENYAKDPSEDNWYALRLADLYVRATEEEDETNKNEVTTGLLISRLLGDSPTNADLVGGIWNDALGYKNSEDESRLWLKHARLERELLQRQRARALQSGASPVSAQLLGMSMYGPQQGLF